MTQHAIDNARRCRLQARLQRILATELARRGRAFEAFAAMWRSHRLAQAADAWMVVS